MAERQIFYIKQFKPAPKMLQIVKDDMMFIRPSFKIMQAVQHISPNCGLLHRLCKIINII